MFQEVELSASFLGALTLLQWACCHADPTVLALENVFPCISRFPVNLTLVMAKKRAPDGPKTPGLMSGGCLPPRAMERKDWGALVTHCYTLYWKCLSSFLKWAELTEERNCHAGGYEEKESVGARVTAVGSADVAEVARCCLDNLDVAALSMGVVIESVSTLLPKVCRVNACHTTNSSKAASTKLVT